MRTAWFILGICLLSSLVQARFDIRDFGAIANDDSLGAEEANAAAIMDALTAARFSSEEQAEVYIPENMTFNSFPIYAEKIRHLTLTIDGTLRASKRNNMWTLEPEKGKIRNFIEFTKMHELKL